MSLAVVSTGRVMALWYLSERLSVGRQDFGGNMSDAGKFVLEIVHRVKKQGEQCSRMG